MFTEILIPCGWTNLTSSTGKSDVPVRSGRDGWAAMRKRCRAGRRVPASPRRTPVGQHLYINFMRFFLVAVWINCRRRLRLVSSCFPLAIHAFVMF